MHTLQQALAAMNHNEQLEIYTVGHSNLELARFVELLTAHDIAVLVDIRRFPSSRKFPHFNREPLAAALAEAGIEYHWQEALGGRRGKVAGADPEQNAGLTNDSFRQYADYMQTVDFQAAIGELRELAAVKRTAIMCAESVFWRCHRRLVSDWLTALGDTVQHIFPAGELRPHLLTDVAKPAEHGVTYPESLPLFDQHE